MTVKDCGNHGDCERSKLYRRICAGILFFILVVLFIILIIWLILRPSKPKYYLQDTLVYGLNLSNSNYLSTTMQVTITAKNPNDKVGIYYDSLHVYAAYKGQQITVPTSLPTGYQGHLDMTVWSPYLYGEDVPLAPFLCLEVTQDETAGYLLLNIFVTGQLRWKVGTFVTGTYTINVNCPALLTVNGGKGSGGAASGGGDGWYHFQQPTACTVDV